MEGCTMKEISVREARQIIGKLDDILEKEGEVQITKRGKPIAKICALNSTRRMPSHKSLRNRMSQMKKESVDLIRSERDDR
jgi:antitoxin (DNA-binding transcriptional repressor) of toxin-antitoxin stability system